MTRYHYGPLGLQSQQQSDDAWVFPMVDALGSVRGVVDADLLPLESRLYAPYGEPFGVNGTSQTVFGFTGEPVDANELVYLRARYYDPLMGGFFQPDPSWQEQNLYQYADSNPTMFVDPLGTWRWRLAGNIYHARVEDHYEGTAPLLVNPHKQLEYTIPPTRLRADMFDSMTGAVYEVEPVYLRWHGRRQATQYVGLLNAAALTGQLDSYTGPAPRYLGIFPYNWNNTFFHLGGRLGWPGRYSQPLGPPFGHVTLNADFAEPGIVVYWFTFRMPVVVPVPVPNRRGVRGENYNPRLAPQPAYVLSMDQCSALVVIAGSLIAISLALDIAGVGLPIPDEVITVPAGLLLIWLGTRSGAVVPVEEIDT